MSHITNPNAPASPTTPQQWEAASLGQTPGLTKREHFAAFAMQGLLAGTDWLDNPHEIRHNRVLDGRALTSIAVDLADELIDALNAKASGGARDDA